MKTLFLTAHILLVSSLGQATLFAQNQAVDEIISRDKVESTLSRLSSDKMMGRKAFTPAARRAAGFIADKFETIGLEPLESGNSYRLEVMLYHFWIDSSAVHLNGRLLSPDHYLCSSRKANVNWHLADKKVRLITGSDDFSRSFSEMNRSAGDLVVLVDPSHREIFRRYARWYRSNGHMSIENEGATRLYILTESKDVAQGRLTLRQRVETRRGQNVAGKITGATRPDEYVLFTAHYDHIGILEPVQEDSIANGADDNASGMTAVLILAEYFAKRGPQARTLIFVGFTAEEMGGFGSRSFAQRLRPEKITALFNIEMIGKPSEFGPGGFFMTGFGKSNTGRMLQKNLDSGPYMVHPDPYPDQNLFFRSDNIHFARLGVPAHTISSAPIDRDPYYHTVDDEMKTLDLQHLTGIIRAIAWGTRSIVEGEDTPNRIDPGALN